MFKEYCELMLGLIAVTIILIDITLFSRLFLCKKHRCYHHAQPRPKTTIYLTGKFA